MRWSLTLALIAAVLATAGCGDQRVAGTRLPAGARPIGLGPRFQPPLRAGTVVPGCRSGAIGTRVGVHVELFAQDRVILLPAALGTVAPRRFFAGRLTRARCHGPVVTIDPTGLLLLRPGTRATVGDVFRLWGRRLGRRRLLSFRGRVRAHVNGRRTDLAPSQIPLRRHDNIVLQVGPHVPPHARYVFPRGF